jgi:peptidoglycan/xylan/chitin deacetylase (PgdA/CDA1 family)
MKVSLAGVLVFGSFVLAGEMQADSNGFIWPDGARAAVNLAYDDAVYSQLDHAIPDLDRYGFHGTFYLTLAHDSVRTRLDEWRRAAANGHELANHAVFHPCSGSKPGRDWVSPGHDLDNMSLEDITRELQVANAFLHAIDGKTERTFTPPCLDREAGGDLYWDEISPLFVAIKGLGGDGVTDDMMAVDPYRVEVSGPVGATAEDLIAIVRLAAERGTMANFTFHGIGGDHLSVSREAHEGLLKHLAENPDIYWVDTFLEIMKFVKSVQGSGHNP